MLIGSPEIYGLPVLFVGGLVIYELYSVYLFLEAAL